MGVNRADLPEFEGIELAFGDDGEDALIRRVNRFVGKRESRLEIIGERMSDHTLIYVATNGDFYTEQHRNIFIAQSLGDENRSMGLDILEAPGYDPKVMRSFMPADRILTRIANQAFVHFERSARRG